MARNPSFPARLFIRVALTLALAGGLMTGPARGQDAPLGAADLERQAYAKIIEARGSARAERYVDALNQLDAAVALAEQLEGKLPLALAFHNKGEVEILRGRPLDALKAYHLGLRVYTQLGHQAGVAMVQRRIGTLTRFVRKPDRPTGVSARAAPPGKEPDRLARIDRAVERIRSRLKAAGGGAPQEPPRTSVPPSPAGQPPPAPVQATPDGEPPPPVQPGGPAEPPPPAQTSRTAEPPPPSVEVARTETRALVDNPRQWAYVETLKRKIKGKSRYPAYAERNGQQGTVEVVFAVTDDGEVDNVELSRSSGFILLDVEALRSVRESAPFGPVPATGTPKPLAVRLTFSYKLSAPADEAPVPAIGSEG